MVVIPACVTPKLFKSSAHPVVTFLTMDAMLELLHDPLEHTPPSHLSAMPGIEIFDEPVTATLKNGPKFRHWASGATSTPCKVVLHVDDKVSRMLVTLVSLGPDHVPFT